ncbi:MAG: glycosyltransferase [Burkholderiaceae bacterium]
MSPKRILFIVDTLRQGGLARVIVVLAEAMSARGHTVGVAVLDSVVEEPLASSIWLTRHDRQRPARGLGAYLGQAAQFGTAAIRDFESENGAADLVIAAGELALRCADTIEHPRLVFSSHSSQLGSPKHEGWLGRWRHVIKRTRRGLRLRRLLNGRNVHVVSQGLAAELRETLGVAPRRLSVIGNPFDIEAIRAAAGRGSPEARAQTRPFVIGVGALSQGKRFDRLVHAFAASRLDGDLILIGQGEQEQHLRALAAELGISERFRIIPFHPNHYALVAKARVLILTSNSEGLGNVLIEALILGVPAISTDCPHGPRDILGDLDPRALVPLDQLELLPERLRDVALNPYPIPESAVERYSLDAIVDQYLALADRLGSQT